MNKKFKTFMMTCLLSVSVLGAVGEIAFADTIGGTERVIAKGEGEVSITKETKASGTTGSPHVSSLSMGNQLINGSGRRYPAGAHSILMTLVERSNPNSGLPNYCKVSLERSKTGSWSRVGSELVNLRNVGATYVSRNARQSSGTFRYVFDNRASTIGSWDKVDYFRANPVKMYAK